MTKFTSLLLACLLLFSAAAADESNLPHFEWEHDGNNHWQLDDSGAVINSGAHILVENTQLCTVCGCDILDWGDGCIDVTDYDAFGNTLRYASFENGEKVYESVHIYTYNADGVVLTDHEYINGVFACEAIYTVSETGEQIPVTGTLWNEDGTVSINEYDAYGNCIRAAVTDSEGNVLVEMLSEYALNDFGWYYECKTTSRFDTGDTYYQEINQYGDTVRSVNTDADGAVWSNTRYEYQYKDGVKLCSKQYDGDQLIFARTFDSDGNLLTETEYLDDGQTIDYLYNEAGDVVSATTHAEDGSVITVTNYEYVYSDDMYLLEIHEHTDGVLTGATVFSYDDEGCFTGFRETVYHADGTRTVEQYDDALMHISTTVYAADNSIISTAATEE